MNSKILFSVLLGALIAVAAHDPAWARCGAKTCSQALAACTGLHCNAERRGNCSTFCKLEFDRCLQTGEFHGRVCQKFGLIKK